MGVRTYKVTWTVDSLLAPYEPTLELKTTKSTFDEWYKKGPEGPWKVEMGQSIKFTVPTVPLTAAAHDNYCVMARFWHPALYNMCTPDIKPSGGWTIPQNFLCTDYGSDSHPVELILRATYCYNEKCDGYIAPQHPTDASCKGCTTAFRCHGPDGWYDSFKSPSPKPRKVLPGCIRRRQREAHDNYGTRGIRRR